MKLDELNVIITSCRKCPRLVAWREQVAKEKRKAFQDEEYWGKPVPGFGDSNAEVFVIGLAPGAHGSNRTGRQFTGDGSGDFLYSALYKAGFASQPTSLSRDDGLILHNLYTAPVCRCVPPGNKPTKQEVLNCLPYLELELGLIKPKVIVALGRIAFDSILQLFNIKSGEMDFSHKACYSLPGKQWLICSYHPSRQNTQTHRLTVDMFDEIWQLGRASIGR
jgi:uracil-DNA glycosylase family 4